jgi:gas vesicle structural protein
MPDGYGYDNEYDRARTPVRRTAESASLAEIVDVILDKGIVFDAWRRVSVPGLGPMTIKAHMVVASVDTLLRYAEEIGLSPLAAPALGQRVTSGRENGQHAARQLPSGEENIVRRD